MPSDDEDYDNSDDPDYKVENFENRKLENEKNLITEVGTSGTEDGYRVYDKKMYCPYCSKPQSKLPRHLISRHSKETEVIKYEIEKDKGKNEKMICKLRNLGNYLHNNEVMKEGKGILVVKYRPSEESSLEDYVPCNLCLGYYSHWDIWKHRNRCVMKPENKATKGRVVNKCRLLIQNNKLTKTTSELDQILASLTNDDIGKVVKRDTMILQWEEKLSKKSWA
ncbi:unnamed protein product [Mytilus coruscus]|uniref:Uncharacterized protein n=1 Tax=Mytilus coruscus TaxID=42192 RepID=A0A6J8EX67_MYTCO|nr:unnamed protein product [Mytilus coruscus]